MPDRSPSDPLPDRAPDPAATEPEPAEAIDHLAEHLRHLGAESEMERRVKRVVPWVSSIVLHGGMIVLGFVIVFGVQLINEEDPVLVSADFRNLQYNPFSMLNPNQDEIDRQTAQDRMRSESIADTLSDQLRELDVDPISLLSDSATRTDLARFAPQPRQGTAKFAGLTGTNARRIIFVVDASGSMITTFGIIIEELARSIDALVPQQSFQIMFFQKNEAVIVPPEDRLIKAVTTEKVRVLSWIRDHIIPMGRSNPIEAIRAALALKPDLIFLLSNDITGSGQFEIDQDDLLATLDRLNPIDAGTGRRRTQIQCVQFLDPDPLNTLKKIALEHGGPKGYKFLSREELGIGTQ